MSLARTITVARGGDWHGAFGLYPGPGRDSSDRSMKIVDSPAGVALHSLKGDDWRAEKNRLRRDGLIFDRANRQGIRKQFGGAK